MCGFGWLQSNLFAATSVVFPTAKMTGSSANGVMGFHSNIRISYMYKTYKTGSKTLLYGTHVQTSLKFEKKFSSKIVNYLSL